MTRIFVIVIGPALCVSRDWNREWGVGVLPPCVPRWQEDAKVWGLAQAQSRTQKRPDWEKGSRTNVTGYTLQAACDNGFWGMEARGKTSQNQQTGTNYTGNAYRP
ncbi:hypothetical protein B0T19DRAFT_28569 [Cercophora scortea]|uniref:Uncharacterized protein n=1 Tax=Cercophora scortea TaxID=314031 RepID=A0AAE0J411_9PEZI|nr:hypothetical protein B0T19DRAFT_28569 [Cercophora scortea]